MTRPARATQTAPPPARRGRPPVAVAQSQEIAVAVDRERRKMVDEFGELDRKLKLLASDSARFEKLKGIIKGWLAAAPPDADGSVQGERYLLQLSQCENERRIRSVRELVAEIGLDAVLDLAVIPITKLENAVGKARVEKLIIEARTGSRRIRCIPLFPAVPPR